AIPLARSALPAGQARVRAFVPAIHRDRTMTHLHPILCRLAAAVLALGCVGSLHAEGTRTLHPSGATGYRGVMSAQYSNSLYGSVVRDNQFLYVYAEAGEVILLGSRNRSTNGDIFVYAPQSFGPKGAETWPGTATFSCSSQPGRGTIGSRLQELAGPNSADGSQTVVDGFDPCFYEVPATGVYGVRFTGASSGTNNTGSI